MTNLPRLFQLMFHPFHVTCIAVVLPCIHPSHQHIFFDSAKPSTSAAGSLISPGCVQCSWDAGRSAEVQLHVQASKQRFSMWSSLTCCMAILPAPTSSRRSSVTPLSRSARSHQPLGCLACLQAKCTIITCHVTLPRHWHLHLSSSFLPEGKRLLKSFTCCMMNSERSRCASM